MSTNTTTTTIGLSDYKLLETKKPWGPQLQFVLTFISETSDGRQLGLSVPGWRYKKDQKGAYVVVAPLSRVAVTFLAYSVQATFDLIDAVEGLLVEEGWRDKVGTNNPLKALRDMPGDLSEAIPEGREHL